jgi:type I restriction enzyme S subunit
MEKLQGKKPHVRFPEFKEAWEHKQLSELLTEAKKRNGDLKYGKDEVLSVSGELGIVNQIEHLGRSYAGVSVHQYHVVEVGDIVYTKSPLKANPYGIIKLNKRKAGIVSTLYAVYTVNKKTACGEFIEHYFSLDANTNRYLRPLVKKGAKNDMKISSAYVLHDRIFVPSVIEQRRIASLFTVLDKKIAELKQKKSLLEQYKKAVMQKLFSQELRFKDENGKEFPKWSKTKLGQIAKFSKGKGIAKTDISDDGNFECIRYGELYTHYGEIISNIKSKTNLDQKDLVFSEENDVIIPASGESQIDIAKASCVIRRGIALGSDLNILKGSFDGVFLSYYLNNKMKNEIAVLAQWVSVVHLYSSQLSTLEIILPSLFEQHRISNFIKIIDDKINRTDNQIQQTQQYKKGLLQNMFI